MLPLATKCLLTRKNTPGENLGKWPVEKWREADEKTCCGQRPFTVAPSFYVIRSRHLNIAFNLRVTFNPRERDIDHNRQLYCKHRSSLSAEYFLNWTMTLFLSNSRLRKLPKSSKSFWGCHKTLPKS